MIKNKKLVIVGTGETADIAYEYFTYDSDYQVVAFSVSKKHIETDRSNGLPVVPFEDVQIFFPPEEYYIYVAISYVKLNRSREKMYNEAKYKGYKLATYISSHAFVWRNVSIGENVFIFENNVVQHHAIIGNNVTLWSGNHIGHRTELGENAYLSSHCVISGFCKIGDNSFLGVNCTFNDNITIARDTVIGSGALIVKNQLEPGSLLVGAPANTAKKTAYEVFKLSQDEI
jgi:sugar O-acyltransferase (sialic acid O-acetyltransferase NeuD family)